MKRKTYKNSFLGYTVLEPDMHLYVNISGRKDKSRADEEVPAQHNSIL